MGSHRAAAAVPRSGSKCRRPVLAPAAPLSSRGTLVTSQPCHESSCPSPWPACLGWLPSAAPLVLQPWTLPSQQPWSGVGPSFVGEQQGRLAGGPTLMPLPLPLGACPFHSRPLVTSLCNESAP